MRYLSILIMLILISCKDAGTTENELMGSEAGLPEELKGLKIYEVHTGDGGYVQVGLLNNELNSLTYPSGKINRTVIMLKNSSTPIIAKEVISQNDSIMVIKIK